MKLLAIETSSLACSVALQVDEDIQERHVVEAKAHTRILLPMINTLLGDAGLIVSDLDALVLGNGPGSFIGMRIGASVAQGLAFAAGLNIIPISSLAAVAAEVFVGADPGAGAGTPLTVVAGVASGDVTAPSAGEYTVGVRAREAAGNWSEATTTTLTVTEPVSDLAVAVRESR